MEFGLQWNTISLAAVEVEYRVVDGSQVHGHWDINGPEDGTYIHR